MIRIDDKGRRGCQSITICNDCMGIKKTTSPEVTNFKCLAWIKKNDK